MIDPDGQVTPALNPVTHHGRVTLSNWLGVRKDELADARKAWD